MELAVQHFLRSGGTLEKLSDRFWVRSTPCPSLGLVALAYTIRSPMQEAITRECRGLFLEEGTWNVACKSVPAFFDLNDPLNQATEAAFTWLGARLYDKLDGAPVFIYNWRGQWHVGERNSPDASNQCQCGAGFPTALSFRDVTLLALGEMGYTWESFTARLDPELFYSFELCAPETRNGVVYDSRSLRLFAAVHHSRLSEIDIEMLAFPWWKARFQTIDSLAEALTLRDAQKDGTLSEGFVAVDRTFRRIKLKTQAYLDYLTRLYPSPSLPTLASRSATIKAAQPHIRPVNVPALDGRDLMRSALLAPISAEREATPAFTDRGIADGIDLDTGAVQALSREDFALVIALDETGTGDSDRTVITSMSVSPNGLAAQSFGAMEAPTITIPEFRRALLRINALVDAARDEAEAPVEPAEGYLWPEAVQYYKETGRVIDMVDRTPMSRVIELVHAWELRYPQKARELLGAGMTGDSLGIALSAPIPTPDAVSVS